MSKEWVLYHNPKCSKSRAALELLQSQKFPVRVVEYLKTPPTEAELRALLIKLGLKMSDAIRTKESVYEQLGLEGASEAELIAAVAKHPVLLERPIAVRGEKAVIGRPLENLQTLF